MTFKFQFMINYNAKIFGFYKLPNVTEVKDLGIIVDHELKFKRHTGYYHQSTSASFTHTEMF